MSDTAPVVAHAGMPPPVVPLPVALRLLSKAVDWTVVAMGAIMIALIFANAHMHPHTHTCTAYAHDSQ